MLPATPSSCRAGATPPPAAAHPQILREPGRYDPEDLSEERRRVHDQHVPDGLRVVPVGKLYKEGRGGRGGVSLREGQ